MPLIRIGLLTLVAACSQALDPGQADELRARIRATLEVAEVLPPLEVAGHGSFEPEPGVVAERLTYSTQFGLRVPAIPYRPKSPRGKIPGLIVVNGHGGDKYSWYSFYSGVLYARAGAAVLTYDPIGEGERNIERKSGTRAHDQIERREQLGRQLGGLMLTDVMQAVSLLSSRPEVDSSRIGAMGYSMGSFVLSLTCAVEPRLKACVLAGGGNLDGPGEYWDGSKPMCQAFPYRSMAFLGDRPAVIYALHALRGSTLIANGLEDTVVAIPTHGRDFFADLQTRARAELGSPQVFETLFTEAVSHRPFFVTRPVALWLESQLDFPQWSAAAIAEAPETHISEWAARYRVEMDRGYSSEHREGGTMALGAGIPGLTREQLNVFSDSDWRRHKGEMILESWLAKRRLLDQP